MTNCLPTYTWRHGSYQSLEKSSAYTLPIWSIPGAMAKKKAKIIIAGSLPLQAWNLLWWAPALEAQIYTLGPLPVQAENNYGGPQHWRPKSTHWPPSSAGRKQLFWRPKSTHWPPSSAGRKQLWWAPALEAQIYTLAPFLCRQENNYGGPHHWRPPNQLRPRIYWVMENTDGITESDPIHGIRIFYDKLITTCKEMHLTSCISLITTE